MAARLSAQTSKVLLEGGGVHTALLAPISMAGMARKRASGLSWDPPARMTAWTFELMSSLERRVILRSVTCLFRRLLGEGVRLRPQEGQALALLGPTAEWAGAL